jgi:ABC-type transport system involved in cytochrome c biogenesis permease subunit
MLFKNLREMKPLYLSPPLVNPQWRPLADVEQEMQTKETRDPGYEAFAGLVESYSDNKPTDFNSVVTEYHKLIEQKMPDTARKLDLEVVFNRAEPFIQCMVLYVMVFLLAVGSWLKWHQALARAALWLLVLTLAFHTFGLVARIYIQGRPPVTNLYSSAIFIAWGAVVFCVALELIYRNAIATAMAAAIAFPSLLIAHYLAASGDTMQMLQAVLDTNIWLATHVVVVTLGYTATFLAGFLGIAYILGGVLFSSFNADARKTVYRMIYGVVCFAMLFSFVGTILGGIWADQSWGRFWGWDPKENGALIIVLWNALVLHARWGGMVKDRGLAMLTTAGNIAVCWSWFGVNELGVGLHSYGFTEGVLMKLGLFVLSQLAIIGLAFLTFRRPAASSAAA